MDNDSMYVYSGGVANITTVYSGGYIVVSSGGVANSTKLRINGALYVSYGGEANDTTVSQFGGLYVYSGGVANSTVVSDGGMLFVSEGGVVNDTTVSAFGRMSVSSGGTAIGTTVNSGGYIVASSGGAANSTTVSSGGQLNVSSGGTANSVWINSGGSLYVSCGGVADSATVSSGGWIYVSSGGTANNATVYSGYMSVSSGGTANSAYCQYYGQAYIMGTINNATVDGSGVIQLRTGGVANSTVVDSGGQLFVSSGGTMYGATVSSRGLMEVSSGGTATNIREDGGFVFVASGAVATFVSNRFDDIVYSGTSASLHSGTTAYMTQVHDYGKLYVCGGKASKTTVSLYGTIEVAGGVATDTTVLSNGWLFVSSGGTADSTTISFHGRTIVSSGGTANNTDVNSDGFVTVLEGGTANSATVNSDGEFCVSSGGTANDTTVSSGGLLAIHEGKATNATVRSGGLLILSSGASLNSATVYYGGTAKLNGIAYVTDFIVNGGIEVQSGGVMSQGAGHFTVGPGAMLTISSGGMVDGAVVMSGALVTVENGGTFATADISAGRVTVHSGALLDSVSLNSGSLLNLTSGAVLRNVRVSSGGVVTGVLRNAGLTFSGGTLDLNIAKSSENDGFLVDATSYSGFKSDSFSCTLTVTNKQLNGTYKLIQSAAGFNKTITVQNAAGGKFGTLTVGSGPKELLDGVTYDLKLSGGSLLVTVTGGAVPDPIVSDVLLINERMDITSGMSAIDVRVSTGGILNVYSDGVASDITVAVGEFNVYSGGKLTGAKIHRGGTATIYDDVIAKNVIVDGGVFVIESDGWAYQMSKGSIVSSNTILKNGGTVIVNGGGFCSGAVISNGGRAIVESDGNFGVATVTWGDVTAKAGAVVSSATLLDSGVMTVKSGGTGGGVVSSGGTICLEDGSELNGLTVSSGGIVTGVMHDLNEVRMYGGTLDLDISEAAPSGEYIVDVDTTFNVDHGMFCTLTVDGNQAKGTYNLMEYAWGYDTQVITAETPLAVKSTAGDTLGTLSVGGTAEIGGAYYTLNLDGDYHLTVTVSDEEPPPPIPGGTAKSDIDGNGISDVMFVWTGNNYAHGYWMNGTSEWQSANSNHPAEWDNLGCYDMTGDGKADSVLFGNVTSEAGIHGAYIGYYADANDLPDGSTWVNIGYLNNVDNIDWKNKVGNLTGNASGVNSIVWYTYELGALGAWTDGVENWVSIASGFDASWTLIGCGDFDGDGRDQVVMAYNSGAKYYAYAIDGSCAELGDSDSGWEVRAIGDFAGDDRDDIVAFHKETGIVAMWGDGDSTKWAQLGQLAATDWFVVGAGDYDGDAKDDLLVRQISTGMLGYYASGNMETGWVELGRGVDMNWTVIA
ncbi:MAG: AIDA repeat-containing protein [Lentisphaeria bacterium]|nr:AIDA repeat-containing protein [Lentisphaeria bacterium]